MAKLHRVVNLTRDRVLAEWSKKASNPISRGIGLTGRKSLPDGGGLIIRPCKSVGSFIMRFPIDVVFVDGSDEVCHTVEPLVPWRASKIVRRSKFVVELPAGTIAETGTEIGDRIQIVEL